MSNATCSHLDQIEIRELPESVDGCEDCLRIGGKWLHMTASDVSVERRDDERRYVLLLGGESAGELVFRDRGGGVLAFLTPRSTRRGDGAGSVRPSSEAP